MTEEFIAPVSSSENEGMDAFHAMLQRSQHFAHAAAMALDEVTPILESTLKHHWSTGQGTRVRHVLWSLFTCSHLVNLGDACSGLDADLAHAVAAAITARLALGPEVENQLRHILEASGEFARFEVIEKLTPENMAVVYPPHAASPDDLRRLADAAEFLAENFRESA